MGFVGLLGLYGSWISCLWLLLGCCFVLFVVCVVGVWWWLWLVISAVFVFGWLGLPRFCGFSGLCCSLCLESSGLVFWCCAVGNSGEFGFLLVCDSGFTCRLWFVLNLVVWVVGLTVCLPSDLWVGCLCLGAADCLVRNFGGLTLGLGSEVAPRFDVVAFWVCMIVVGLGGCGLGDLADCLHVWSLCGCCGFVV